MIYQFTYVGSTGAVRGRAERWCDRVHDLRGSLDLSARAVDAGVLILLFGAGFAACWLGHLPFLAADALLFALPLAYLWIARPAARAAVSLSFTWKAVAVSLVFFDSIGGREHGWRVATVLPRLPAGIPVEDVVWASLAVLLPITANARFFARRSDAPGVRWTRWFVRGLFAGAIVVALVPPLTALLAGHVYLKLGLILYPGIFAAALLVDRRLLRELSLVAITFLAVNFLFELLALHNGYWTFPGRYVTWVTLPGHRFPLEELLFIMLLSAPGIVATNALRLNWRRAGAGRRRSGCSPQVMLAVACSVAAVAASGCGSSGSHAPAATHARPQRLQARQASRAALLTASDLEGNWEARSPFPLSRCGHSPWDAAVALTSSPSYTLNLTSVQQAVGIFRTDATAAKAFAGLNRRATLHCFYRFLRVESHEQGATRVGAVSAVRSEYPPHGVATRLQLQVYGAVPGTADTVYIDDVCTRVGRAVSTLVITWAGGIDEAAYGRILARVIVHLRDVVASLTADA